MNSYLYYSNTDVAKNIDEEQRKIVIGEVRSFYEECLKVFKEGGEKSYYERMIEKYGEEKVTTEGFAVLGINKPVIMKIEQVSVYDDTYEIPVMYYADDEYDYGELDQEYLKSFLMGYNFYNVAAIAAGGGALTSQNIALEGVASRLYGSMYRVTIPNQIPTEYNEDTTDKGIEYTELYNKALDDHIDSLQTEQREKPKPVDEKTVEQLNFSARRIVGIKELRDRIARLIK